MAQLLLVGTGLIGGSFAMAMRRAGVFDRVLGHDRDASALMRAADRGIVDDVLMSFPRDFDGVGAAFVAVHPSGVGETLAKLLKAGFDPTVPIFDAASVKGSVLRSIESRMGKIPRNFVPCHPMAGGERKGPDAATADLFDGSRVFVTASTATFPAAVEQVSDWWRACGAVVVATSPEIHDAHVAWTSHLPHMLAFAYLRGVAQRWDDALPGYTGPGFRDFTRIGAADPELWRQIVEGNTPSVVNALEAAVHHTRHFLELIRAGRFDDLERELEIARDTRQRFSPLPADSAGDVNPDA